MADESKAEAAPRRPRTRQAEAAVVKAKDGVIQGMWEEIEKAERKGEATAALVEKVIMAKVVQSSNRAEALERRLKNARFVSEASERLAAEAVARRETLGEVHAVRLAAINAAETAVRDFESDPELTLPIGTTKRRNLQKTRAKLGALVHDSDSANDMAERLDGVARLDDATRTAAARGDGET
ncbi:hypothetical protein JL721_9738 [Aureococcus anophagefferens]|nr:hypothetical protein JL721_9738 [Aureococcus anophagefferens]